MIYSLSSSSLAKTSSILDVSDPTKTLFALGPVISTLIFSFSESLRVSIKLFASSKELNTLVSLVTLSFT